MPAHSVIAQALRDTYSLASLKTSQATLLAASLSPDSLTGEQLEGVSFQFAPRTSAEIVQALENVAAAIAKHDSSDQAGNLRSRFINFNSRPIE